MQSLQVLWIVLAFNSRLVLGSAILSKVLNDFVQDANAKSCKVLHVYQNPAASASSLSSINYLNSQLVMNLGVGWSNESINNYLDVMVKFPQCSLTFLFGDRRFATDYLSMMLERGWTRSHYKYVVFPSENASPEIFFGADTIAETFYHLILVTSKFQVICIRTYVH